MGMLYIVSGASGSGKSTLVASLLSDAPERFVMAPKYTERPPRLSDDVIHVDRIEDARCDIVYVLNQNYYGIRASEIEELLEGEKDVFIILSDFRVVAEMKRRFGSKSRTIYVSSAIDPDSLQQVMAERHKHEFRPSDEQSLTLKSEFYRLQCAAQLGRWPTVLEGMGDLLAEWNHVVPHAESQRIRLEKIRTLHNRYIDRIALFDHVVLNHGAPADMSRQMWRIVDSAPSGLPSRPKAPVLFVVAAASGAGKGLLMETISRLLGDRIGLVVKEALRDGKPNDRRDGMKALGSNGKFSDSFSFIWRFHKSDTGDGTPYAIDPAEVQRALDSGLSQIVISNIDVFPEFRKRFGNHVVFVYLHATRPESAIREFQYQNCKTVAEAEFRIREIRDVHEDYMDHICEFHHVLLNTSFMEDLFDQMLALLTAYDAF